MVEHAEGCARRAMQGVYRYRETDPSVQVILGSLNPHHARQWNVDGALVISPFLGPDSLKRILHLQRELPVSAIAIHTPHARQFDYSVQVDERDVGRQAALHLLQQGFRSFGFLALWDLCGNAKRDGTLRSAVVHERFEGFCSTIAEASPDYTVSAYPSERGANSSDVRDWLSQLPHRTGILLFEDSHGPWIYGPLAESGRSVPDDLALVSVGNDEHRCLGSVPSLSSVLLPMEAMGEAAIRSVVQRTRPGRPGPRQTMIPVPGVEVRESSNAFVASDPVLSKAMNYLESHIRESVTVDQLARASGINRRSLEYRFRKELAQSPLVFIHRARMSYAAARLREGVPPGEVALHMGFNHPSQFSRLFRQVVGVAPSAFHAPR